MSLMPFLGASRWRLRQQVAALRAERKRLEAQIEALTAVADEVLDTAAFVEGMSVDLGSWIQGVLVPLAEKALKVGKEKS